MREVDTTNETNGGEQRQRDQREKDRGGGEKMLDTWLLEFNKRLKEKKQQ